MTRYLISFGAHAMDHIPDATVTDGPDPEAIGGFSVIEVPSRQEALRWAAKQAAACRCAQEVWEFGPDPELDAMFGQADRRR